MTLSIRKYTSEDHARWDNYVEQHPQGSFFHLSGWQQVISQVLAHHHHYLLAEDDSKNIVGILPLAEQKSYLFGHALISTPLCVYGGVLADNDDTRLQLESYAYQLGVQLNVDYIELRDREALQSDKQWQIHSNHATFLTELPPSSEQILSNIKRKQRAVIRHSQKNGLTWENQTNTKTCYQLYAESVRNLGTPVFHQQLFDTLLKVFPHQSEILVIKNATQKPVSSVLSFYYKNTVLPYYAGATPKARALKSHDYMYFQLMQLAHQQGNTHFDFGRSKRNSGSYQYKRHWGMNEHPLHYKYALVKAKRLPNLSPNNPKYQLAIKIWKKLPLSVSKFIGPHLAKYLG